jgi:recombination protein RecA
LLTNPEVANEIEKKIKQKLGIGVPKAVADLPAEVAEVAVEAEKPAKAASAS